MPSKKIHKIVLLFLFIFSASVGTFAHTDSVAVKEDSTVFISTKSSWGAVLRSAVVPGWGQFYNESYWKIPVFLGIGGWFVYNYLWNDDKYQENRSAYIISNNYVDKAQRDFYRDQRDEFAVYLGLTYFAMLVDAYVDAELFDFTVREDDITGSKKVQMNFRFAF